MDDEALDAVFAALAHPSRRAMIDVLVESPGSNVGEVASWFDMSRVAVMKHLRVLEDAGLVISKAHGRERRLYFNAVPIQRIHDRWADQYAAFFATKLVDIKDRVEARIRSEQRKGNRRA
ncbi:MAG: metalloregulator ArsR/SmtB family transcription factor [Planctomycetota bacterium]